MKIRFLIANAYASGGTIRTTVNMANALARRGHKVEIASVHKNRSEPAFKIDPRVRLRPLVDRSKAGREALEEAQSPRARLVRLARRYAEQQPSRLIHPQDFRYAGFTLWSDIALMRYLRSFDGGVLVGTRAGLNLAIARWAKPSVVRVGQEHLHLGLYKGDLRAAIKQHYRRLDAYATLTGDDAEAYRELLGEDMKLVTIPNAVPAIKNVRSSCDNKVVIAAGRLTRQKGFDRMIAAYALVAAKHPEWELRIFGGGSLRDELQAQIDAADLGDHIKLMGFTTRLADEMAASSIFLMTSRFEGFPMVLLEAMKCGLPVVSYDLKNGPRDLVTHGADGLVVPNQDAEALAAALTELMEDDERRKTMGAAAIEKAKAYDIPSIARQWELLFRELQAAQSPRSPGRAFRIPRMKIARGSTGGAGDDPGSARS